MSFIYPIYNHNWTNISTIYIYIYIYITRIASNEIFSPSNKIHWEVGRAKDLSASRYVLLNYGQFKLHNKHSSLQISTRDSTFSAGPPDARKNIVVFGVSQALSDR